MNTYGNRISLIKNGRGVYSLDPILGCESGMKLNGRGCYGDCYAASYARRYGYDFSKAVLRYFDSDRHAENTVKKINKIEMPFVRMGTSGDPSEDWSHTLYVLAKIKGIRREIVIITKHWNSLTDSQLSILKSHNVCVNTSVSAMDNQDTLENAMEQYERIKPFCSSVLRIVTCDFNKENSEGERLSKIQDGLTKNIGYIDTVFRPSKNNRLILDGVINTSTARFLDKKVLVSKMNKKTFLGKCEKCSEMCGAKTKSISDIAWDDISQLQSIPIDNINTMDLFS